MNIKNDPALNNNELISWVETQWDIKSKQYLSESDELLNKKILLSLAKALRAYINATRHKRGGLETQYKRKAGEMITFLETILRKLEWDSVSHVVISSIQYARKHAGNIGIEGAAVKGKLSAGERKRLRALTRKGDTRHIRSAEVEQPEDDARSDDLRSLGVVNGEPEVD